ncbi:hypothetical protein MKEN_00944300 [Mycena kentingensis (nom. inval.)]|nr:hypothetical protein MKEN_00944300 [Mycena kentingensis (nom. inval.)]
MAPLRTALTVASTSIDDVFTGNVDGDWAGPRAPNGGYVLGLIIQSCVERQASGEQRDPIHVTAHFLQPSTIAPFRVEIRVLKSGRRFTNLLASLVQENEIRITTHIIFGSLAPSGGPGFSSASPYARRHPLHIHPSIASLTRMIPGMRYVPHVRWAHDPILRAQNFPNSPARTNSSTIGGGGVVYGAWFQLTDPEERITPAAIAFLADTFINLPMLLPKAERQGVVPAASWFPTVTMNIEYKAVPNATHAARTVAIFARGTFWGEPNGRHDCHVEIWTAPCELGDKSSPAAENWRDTQICIATSTQMALCLSAKPRL